MENTLFDIVWLVICAILVFNMQIGFLCLESGLIRSKNAINVAVKNVTDFALAVLLYWLYGFGLMFGQSLEGWVGASDFLPKVGSGDAWLAAFFLFQAMFCATAVTIISGATAERLRFAVYIIISALVAGLIYPVFGHWAWGGSTPNGAGWLGLKGFVDFAGSTVVHSVGGWVALAVLLIIGPRQGRFSSANTAPHAMPGSNLPLAMLGALLLFFGWFGFNGGSTLSASMAIPGIMVNTLLGGMAGTASVLVISWKLKGYTDATQIMNGLLAGLVAITASAHVVEASSAILIGMVGGGVMMLADAWLLRWQVDDAVAAVPVHLAAGIWGTLAVALLGDPERLGTGLDRWAQFGVQCEGIVICALWSFGVAYLLLWVLNRFMPLRINPEAERLGLNIAEHGARTELFELLEAMEGDARNGGFHGEVPVEPFTEVGQIASQYNKVIRALGDAVDTTQAIVRDIRDGIITFTQDGRLTSLNPGSVRLFALAPEFSLAQAAKPLTLQDLLKHQEGFPEQLLPPPGGEAQAEVLCQRQDGSTFLAELTVSREKSAQQAHYTGILRDITERRRIEEQLSQEKRLAQVTLASIGDGVITTDRSGQVTYLNPMAEQLTGWSREEAEGQKINEVYQLIDDELNVNLPNPVFQLFNRPDRPVKHTGEQHRALIPRSGEPIPIQDAAAPIRHTDGHLIGAVLTFSDVSVSRRLARKLAHQAAHDALTGLINREEFERRLNSLLSQYHPAAPLHGESKSRHNILCYLDLDQFKIVNDTCGHIAGDELLRQLANLFRSRLRATDELARLGGDEFGVLLYQCEMQEARQIAENIRAMVENFRFSWQNKSFAIGVSIGLVPIDGLGHELSPLLGAADAACYAAKEAGRNRIHLYEPDDQLLLERQGEMHWVNRIRRALDEDRLRLYVQPIVGLQDNTAPIYEVLIRMLDEQNRVIPPGAFMPAAERYNVAAAIDRWVIANTLAWLGDHVRQQGHFEGYYAINLTADSLNDEDFLDFVLNGLERYQVPPAAVCFEITETNAIANLSNAIVLMERLKAIGCIFALDDFGSGVSSFGYLKNLPVDYIKIDGSFVKDIHQDTTAHVMVASINNIGHEMGLKTVAEFVENEAILEALQSIGVDYAQGFHLGKPQPLTELAAVRMMPR
ncbi:ammonia permease [Terasakiispira papahanaumokuakeensis]|uniref:Ammonia permease n=1 Tax=Terasakiispira papahanaumokuakeensis TaxID=197479 RepID=A0A1E2V7L9_9GAMM|nr:ammonium transporter [Terasakiispira papahanaumokuakeensis]ODC02913.1 ammonia permease [Terasakiispira papahanaumokuakeensis]